MFIMQEAKITGAKIVTRRLCLGIIGERGEKCFTRQIGLAPVSFGDRAARDPDFADASGRARCKCLRIDDADVD